LSLQKAAVQLSVLRKRAEFLAVAAHGKKWVTQSFIIQLAPLPKDSDPAAIRYGLTASGKVGNAVLRNRCRRRLRALVHEILPCHATPSYTYVLIARAATATRDYADLKKDLLWALKKTGALREIPG
jgi:ribonuclease P protein component